MNVYSIFQCYPLWRSLNNWRIASPTVDQIAERTDQELGDATASTCKLFRNLIPDLKASFEKATNAALLCQAISNRYYPQTQTDQRTLRISTVALGWDWHEYCRGWNAKQVAQEIGIEQGDLMHVWKLLVSEAAAVDPLRDWDDLIPFIAVEQRQRLKGKALLADLFRSMASMLALFYEEVTGTPVSAQSSLHDSLLHPEESKGGMLRQLDYVTNKYHLNPRPRLILMVEGETEVDQIPRLMELFWEFSPSRAGIEIHNLKGVANFTGNPKRERSGLLRRFIDDYHNRQTMVYIVLDNEGGAEHIKRELIASRSLYFANRFVTTEQLIHIWQLNYEFDNFTDTEIARAMTDLATNNQFTQREVRTARDNFSKGNTLGKLFEEKTGARLLKRELSAKLTDILIEEADLIRAVPQRPIIDQLSIVLKLAGTNHQPTSGEGWERNQKSGFWG